MNRKKYIFITLILIVFIFIGVFLLAESKPSNKILTPGLTPTPSPILPPTSRAPGGYEKLLDKIKNRPDLTISDATIRSELISSLGDKSGTLYSSGEFQIDYLKTPNVFQVRILASDTDTAKQNAMKWFQSKGLSKNGICNLPVMFYLDFSLLKQFPNLKNSFNPLPPGC